MPAKYFFNPHKLEFELKKFSFKTFLKNLLTHSLIIFTVGVSLGYFLYMNTQTFEQKRLDNENNEILWKISYYGENLKTQWDEVYLLNKYENEIFRNVLGLKKNSLEALAYGGRHENYNLNIIPNGNEIAKYKVFANYVSYLIKEESNSLIDVKNSYIEKEAKIMATPSIIPLAKNDLIRISSDVGMRLHPVYKIYMIHTGIDLSANAGKNVYCSADGIVVEASFLNGYGYCVFVNHGYNYQTRYAHLSKILVNKGQKVKRGDVIGLVGNTGTSNGPHLHYEVRINGKPISPKKFFNDTYADQYLQPENFENIGTEKQ